MAAQMLTEKDICELLVTVGVNLVAASDDLRRSFEELELDSLARIEIASRVLERFGVEVEEDLTSQESPTGMLQLVNKRLAEATA